MLCNAKVVIFLSALSLEAVKLVLGEMAAFHATAHHYIETYPGGLEVLAKETPRVKAP